MQLQHLQGLQQTSYPKTPSHHNSEPGTNVTGLRFKKKKERNVTGLCKLYAHHTVLLRAFVQIEAPKQDRVLPTMLELTSETFFYPFDYLIILNASTLVAMPSPLGKQTHAAKLR